MLRTRARMAAAPSAPPWPTVPPPADLGSGDPSEQTSQFWPAMTIAAGVMIFFIGLILGGLVFSSQPKHLQIGGRALPAKQSSRQDGVDANAQQHVLPAGLRSNGPNNAHRAECPMHMLIKCALFSNVQEGLPRAAYKGLRPSCSAEATDAAAAVDMAAAGAAINMLPADAAMDVLTADARRDHLAPESQAAPERVAPRARCGLMASRTQTSTPKAGGAASAAPSGFVMRSSTASSRSDAGEVRV